jgi:hypothetical protein
LIALLSTTPLRIRNPSTQSRDSIKNNFLLLTPGEAINFMKKQDFLSLKGPYFQITVVVAMIEVTTHPLAI